MRPLATIPALLAAGALALSFLCLFAGYNKSFMQDYAILTLNVSRFGVDFLNTTNTGSNPVSQYFHSITNGIENDINNAEADIAHDLGLQDWYSAHMLDYCYGNYTPQAVPNATVSAKQIHKAVSACSNHTAMFYFNAHTILQQALNNSHINSKVASQLDQLGWPTDLDKALNAVRVAWKTAFIVYCIAIGLIGISFLASVVGICLGGRITACVEGMVAFLAFLAILLASAIMTAVAVKASHAINKYGNPIGVSAQRGARFLILTWCATGAMLFSVLVWGVECCIGRRDHKRSYAYKNG